MGLYNQDLESALRFAPEGTIWICGACGKTSKPDKYGLEGTYSRGWDESCMLNAILCDETTRQPVRSDGKTETP